MTRPRPRIEVSLRETSFSGMLEKPIIYLGNSTNEKNILKTLTHEYIHWILQKRLGEDCSSLFDRLVLRDYS
jgi:uncharacterized protein YjaZ